MVCLLTACFPGVYKLDIPQGNILEQEKINQLKIGMNKRQVRYLLGTPLVIDSFNQDRWDYYYSYKYYLPGNSEPVFHRAQLVLRFEKGQLVNIDKQIPENFFPPAAADKSAVPESATPESAVPPSELPEQVDLPESD